MLTTADGAPADDPTRTHDPTHTAATAGPDPDGGLMQVTPRVLAGPGEPGTALAVLRAAGWQVGDDDLANAHAWSPDALVYVGFLPEGDTGQQHHIDIDDADGGATADYAADADVTRTPRVLWQVRAYRHPNAPSPVWTATFTDDTPAELVAAFLAAVADPAGITRDPLDPAGMLHDPNPQPDTPTSP